MSRHEDKHERIPRFQEEFADSAAEHTPGHLDTAAGHRAGANVGVRHRGCSEVDCMHSVLRIVDAAVAQTVGVRILASSLVEVMRRVLEEEVVVLGPGSEKSLRHCRKDAIDMVVEVMTSADPDMAQTVFDTDGTCACRPRERIEEGNISKCMNAS